MQAKLMSRVVLFFTSDLSAVVIMIRSAIGYGKISVQLSAVLQNEYEEIGCKICTERYVPRGRNVYLGSVVTIGRCLLSNNGYNSISVQQ